MTPADLKQHVESANPESKFFTRNNMKFSGDRMSNYGVRGPIAITTLDGDVQVWELYRRKPVKHGLQESVYFRCDTFRQTWTKKVY
jgi:hypothetical protein